MTINSIDKLKKYLKTAIIGIVALAIYFFLPLFEGIIFELLNIDTAYLPMGVKVAYAVILDILMIAILILLLNKSIKKDFIDIKKNHKEYYQKYFKYYLIGLFVMMVSNLIISAISKGGNAGNQEAITDLFKVAPVYVYCSAVFIAPIVEELVFRRAIKNIIPNSLLFILTSGLIFGGLHVIGNVEMWYDVLYLIPYSALGISFAYILHKTDNIFVTIGLHFMHNGILMALQVLTLIFG